MWKYYSNISQLGFFIFLYYSSFLSFYFIHTFFFLFHTHLSLSLFIYPFFYFFFSLIQEVLSFSQVFLQLLVSGFFFFFSFSIHICPYLFLSPPSFLSFSPSFKKCSHSLRSFSNSCSLFSFLFFFLYLIPEQPLHVFVKRVGERGHLCKNAISPLFSPQFSSRFGRKKIVGPGEKIFSRVFFPQCFPPYFPPLVFHHS